MHCLLCHRLQGDNETETEGKKMFNQLKATAALIGLELTKEPSQYVLFNKHGAPVCHAPNMAGVLHFLNVHIAHRIKS